MSQGKAQETQVPDDKQEMEKKSQPEYQSDTNATSQETLNSCNCGDNCVAIDDGASNCNDDGSFCFTNTATANLEYLRKMTEQFMKDRNWHQFNSPRNVLLALVGEVGELAEIFQWKGEVTEGLPELSQAERDHVGQEVSDVLFYLIDFASRCHIDIPTAVASKMAANSLKYPVDKAYGKSNKYTDYK
uniref:dCTP pyrophosphatase 1 n=2 Tax=Arion vulgaris TaxID=1028688 RepID=A0A0B7A9G1_9EUPU